MGSEKRKPANWATFVHTRNPGAPRAGEKPPRPEVLPRLSPEEEAQREERGKWLREILEVDDE